MDNVMPDWIDGESLIDADFDELDGWSGVPDWLPTRPDDGLYWDMIQ